MEEGYIKFNAQWQQAPPLPSDLLKDIRFWRNEMHRLRLIGVYDDGIGYGNISTRLDEKGAFIISGSATGHLPGLLPEHFSSVTDFDIEKNTVYCTGPAIASSESMSHAVIYRECPAVNGVIHFHHAGLWENLLDEVPTTTAEATYGSPEMARSIFALLNETDLQAERIFVMKGHPEGIFTFGKNLEEAAEVLQKYLRR